jgi:hypothetical protein
MAKQSLDPLTMFQIHALCMVDKYCHVCNKRKKLFVKELNMCAECADDEVEAKTGCRFGEANCNHSDCRKM